MRKGGTHRSWVRYASRLRQLEIVCQPFPPFLRRRLLSGYSRIKYY